MDGFEKLRITKRYQEIFKTISSDSSIGSSFIWKSQGTSGNRFPSRIRKIDTAENRILVELGSDDPDFIEDENVFFKLGSRNAAFKAKVLGRIDRIVSLSFPDEMVLEENRVHPRFYFHSSESKMASLGKDGVSDSVLVSNVSGGGMAFFLPLKNHARFEPGKRVLVFGLGAIRLLRAASAEILFKRPIEIQGEIHKKKGYQVGVRFDEPLDPEVVNRFVVRKSVFSIHEKLLVRDQEFRERVKVNIGRIKMELTKQKAFRKFMQNLEVLEDESMYFQQHIHLLCHILTGVGTQMGWISERSIDKLIYVAYLHDIRFMDHPRLARIPDFREFLRVRAGLTKEEQVAFLESPAYSADLARQDLAAFPDAIKILSQQKELPDGQGFPHGVTHVHISPLSALFIVCHELVDYMIRYPDWTLDEFVKKYRFRFKGGYFGKIMGALESEFTMIER